MSEIIFLFSFFIYIGLITEFKKEIFTYHSDVLFLMQKVVALVSLKNVYVRTCLE